MSLYIGANYHPHDWPRERWPIDVEMMKKAGFTTVRLGHLCWDSFEPDNGVYTFEWFDEVMGLFADAGIGVVLDISMHPAPMWVHCLCKGCNIGGINGDYQYPVRRYMEDVSDPGYQHYALRFAKTLVNRYKDHPALFAFGLCNELGWCHRSHSAESRARFIDWLRKKYGTIERLNQAWATQRWCRRLLSFEQVGFPETEEEAGSPEAWLDMRRFFSDGVGEFITALQKTVKENAQEKPTTSNHYAENPSMGFDYMKYYEGFVEYPGVGYYFNYYDIENIRYVNTEMQHRIAETDRPMWCIEYQTGGFGIHHGRPGVLRMMMLYSLLCRNQMILGWTWRTMLAGEEQFVVGLLEHDGLPNVNFDTYVQVAGEFKKLEQYAFPYNPVPEIGVAHSYDADWVIQYPNNIQFKQDYKTCMREISRTFYQLNRDYNIINLKRVKHDYKLIILPSYLVMTQEEADYIRQFVQKGGYVIMTAYSATLDEHSQAFACTRPGRLADVFGIRIGGYERPGDGQYYEEFEQREAMAFETDPQTGACLVSCNQYGKGKAFYTSGQMDHVVMTEVIRRLEGELGLTAVMTVPEGIQVREIAEGQYYFVNTTDKPLQITLPGEGQLVLHDMQVCDTVTLNAFDADLFLVQTKQM